MEYIKQFELVNGEQAEIIFIRNNADGSMSSYSEAPGWLNEGGKLVDANSDYLRMMEEVEAGASTIVEVDITPPVIPEWEKSRKKNVASGGYGTDAEQWEILGEQGIDAFEQHIADVKAAHPKA
jgi:hypothetical protein